MTFPDQGGVIPNVGQYPGFASPWGMLDMSGGWSEWIEDLAFLRGSHFLKGSNMISNGNDILRDISESPPGIDGRETLRIASAIPRKQQHRPPSRWRRAFVSRADRKEQP